MPSYMLRNLPPELLDAARAQAATEGIGLQAMMHRLLERGLHPGKALGHFTSARKKVSSAHNALLGGATGGRPPKREPEAE